MTANVVLGIDIGTASAKAVARSTSHRGAPYVQQRTPWHTGSCGQTQIDAHALAGVAVDHRGGNEIERLAREAPGFAAAFERTTGLPWSSQASLAKLAWLRASGYPAGPASTWLSVPEWIVFALGGDPVREPSLASRTGLIDQGTGEVWPDALAAAGLSARIVARVLTPAASGLLSDPTYGVPAITEAKALAPDCGLLIAAEPTARLPCEPDLLGEGLAVCDQIIRDCRDRGVPVAIENLVYARPGEDLHGRAREDAIVETARALDDLDIDLLKLEHPGSPEGCRRLAAVLRRPWAVLSAGVPFDQFTDIIRIAADEGGASGFIAGRSVWREVVGLAGPHREEFLTSVALPRLEMLVDVAAERARPWTEVSRRPPAAGPVPAAW